MDHATRLSLLRNPRRSCPDAGSPARNARSTVTSLVLLFAACGASAPATDDIESSRREVELAAALQEEGNMPAAIGHLRRALELDEENAEAHLLMALVQMQRANLEGAETHSRAGVHWLVEHERAGATLAEARNLLGVVLIERQKLDEAIVVLTESAQDEMNTAPHLAWGNLGRAYLAVGKPRDSLEPLRSSVRLQPRFCAGYYDLGRAFFELNDFAEAERALTAGLDADPACADSVAMQCAWRLRGEVRARLQHYSEARSDLERCAALSPDSSDGRVCVRLLDEDSATAEGSHETSANSPASDSESGQLSPPGT